MRYSSYCLLGLDNYTTIRGTKMLKSVSKKEIQGMCLLLAGMILSVYSIGWLATIAVWLMIWGNNLELLGKGVIGRNRG